MFAYKAPQALRNMAAGFGLAAIFLLNFGAQP